MSGVQTPNLSPANEVDDVLGNWQGNTVRLPIARLAAIVGQQVGPTYVTRAGLYADLSWPSGTIATVWGDAAAQNGTYRKSGAAGTGSWSRLGDLPQNPLTAAQLAAKADASALAEETTARINATRVAGVILLANVGGTANAITATVAPALPGVTISVQSTVEVIPGADNTATSVTLNVDQLGNWRVRRRDGSDPQPGDIRANRGLWLRRRDNEWWMVSVADSETATAIRATQRRVLCRQVSVSAGGIVATMPPGVSVISDSDTIFDLLWPAGTAWPVASDALISLRIARSDGSIAYSETTRLVDHANGPTPGAIWSIFPPPDSNPARWREAFATPSQKDVATRAKATEVAARFGASFLAERQIAATRDATVTAALRLVLPEEPATGTVFSVVVPEDAPAGGLTIGTPARSRAVGRVVGASAPVAVQTRFTAGDVLSLETRDNFWFVLRHWWPGGKIVADLQAENTALKTQVETLRTTLVQMVEQVDDNLPTRPDAPFVLWHGWTDPTERMVVGDIWVKPSAPPALPRAPSDDELAAITFQGAPGGATSALFRTAVAKQFPALKSIQFSLDGGAWQTLRAAPFAVGDVVAMGNLAPGDHRLRFRYGNFLGYGASSAERLIRAHGADFFDDFLQLLGPAGTMLGRDNWATETTNLVIDSAGVVRASSGIRNSMLTARCTFGGLSTFRAAGLFVEADIERLANSARTPLVGFINASAGQTRGVFVGMLTGDRMALISQDTAGTLNTLADVALPQGHQNAGRGRIEVSADGTTVSSYLNGTLIGTAANPLLSAGAAQPSLVVKVPSGSTQGIAGIAAFKGGKIA